MNQFVKIEIPVAEAKARALTDSRALAAVGRLVDRMVRPAANDPLSAVLEATAADARAAGLTDAGIEAELAAYSARASACSAVSLVDGVEFAGSAAIRSPYGKNEF